MNPSEWCAVVHVDIGSRTGLEETEQLLRDLVAAIDATPGTISLAVLRIPTRLNHFELIGRYASEAAYLEHLVSPSNLAFRSGVAKILGSPYEDRLHGARGAQRWPLANVGDTIVITQLEARPADLDDTLRAIDAFAASERAADATTGQVVLQRHYLPNNLELISVWSDAEAFDAHVASDVAQSARSALAPKLLAPVDDRRYELVAGAWTAE